MDTRVCKLESLERHAVSSPQFSKNAERCQEPRKGVTQSPVTGVWTPPSWPAAVHYAELTLKPVFSNLSWTKNGDTHEMQGVHSSPNRGQELAMIGSNSGCPNSYPPCVPSTKCEHFPVSFGSLESQFKDTGSSSSETPASIRH